MHTTLNTISCSNCTQSSHAFKTYPVTTVFMLMEGQIAHMGMENSLKWHRLNWWFSVHVIAYAKKKKKSVHFLSRLRFVSKRSMHTQTWILDILPRCKPMKRRGDILYGSLGSMELAYASQARSPRQLASIRFSLNQLHSPSSLVSGLQIQTSDFCRGLKLSLMQCIFHGQS